MKKLSLSCKKATWLISLKEERKLSLLEKAQLRAHLGICSMCTLFEKQTAFISKNAGNAHIHLHSSLTNTTKEKMNKAIREITSGK